MVTYLKTEVMGYRVWRWGPVGWSAISAARCSNRAWTVRA